jgi:hypothetical protein
VSIELLAGLEDLYQSGFETCSSPLIVTDASLTTMQFLCSFIPNCMHVIRKHVKQKIIGKQNAEYQLHAKYTNILHHLLTGVVLHIYVKYL